MSIDILAAYIAAAFILSISPGPSNLYIMARNIGQGVKAGVYAALGMAIGSVIFVIAAALGISAIFQVSPTAYMIVKYLGALYLLYLGIQHFRQANAPEAQDKQQSALSHKKVFKQSILVELTNPKSALFFIAFLPQFVSPSDISVTHQLLILGGIYALIALACDLLVANLSAKIGRWISGHQTFMHWQDRIAGTVLLGLGAAIIMDTNHFEPQV